MNCRRVRIVKTTVAFFIRDQLIGALLIHLNFIILTLICFLLMMPGVNYKIHGYSSVRTVTSHFVIPDALSNKVCHTL